MKALVCVLIVILFSGLFFILGFDLASDMKENPFDCYEWQEFVCVDRDSEFYGSDVMEQFTSRDNIKEGE